MCVCVCDSSTVLGASVSITGANGPKEGFCVAKVDRDGIFQICSQTFPTANCPKHGRPLILTVFYCQIDMI